MNWNVKRLDSAEETVSKYVFTSADAVAEAVLYRYPTYEARTVLCISTQSGCPVGCRFCGAGDRFVRSLTSAEIVAQVDYALADRDIDASRVKRFQIMFMSMGEPLLNFRNLAAAIETLHELYPDAALLVSTSAPAVSAYGSLRALSARIPQVGLQFSVHESTDAARNKLIPFADKLTLAQIAGEGEAWSIATGRRPFINYCVHDENNGQDDVDRLRTIFRPETWEATLSVICERDESVSAAHERQRQLTGDFAELMLAAGFSTRMFDPAGQDDIGGGCGQLWYVQEWMRQNPGKARLSIGGRQ